MDELKENFRTEMKKKMPDVKVSFEPIELTDKILSQGSPTPIEVRIGSRNKKQNEVYAKKVVEKLKAIPYLRDVQIAQPINYPALNINIDRVRAAQLALQTIRPFVDYPGRYWALWDKLAPDPALSEVFESLTVCTVEAWHRSTSAISASTCANSGAPRSCRSGSSPTPPGCPIRI